MAGSMCGTMLSEKSICARVGRGREGGHAPVFFRLIASCLRTVRGGRKLGRLIDLVFQVNQLQNRGRTKKGKLRHGREKNSYGPRQAVSITEGVEKNAN